MTVVLMPRMQTSRAYEFMGVNPPSFPSIPPHENAALACKTLVHALVTSTIDFGNAALFGITGTLLHRLEIWETV